MRLRVFLPVIFFALLCAGWSVLWKVTATSVDTAIDDWFADERTAGRDWACAERSLSGYPFRIEVRCASPRFTGGFGGLTGEGHMGDLLAVSNVYQPNLIVATATSPLRATASNGMSFQLAWADLRVSHRMEGGELQQIGIEIDRPDVTLARPGASPLTGRATRLEFFGRPAETPDPAFEVALRAVGVSIPQVDTVTGESDPFDLVTRLIASGRGLADPAPLPQRLETWRLAGGRLQIVEAKTVKGPARLEASGTLGLDQAHRPSGRVNLSSTGLEPILKRLGIPAAAVSIGSLLSNLLPGARADAQAAQTEGGMKLSITLENGRVTIGPVRTPFVVAPLY